MDTDTDAAAFEDVREAVLAAGMVPLVIAPHGGTVSGIPVQRTFATGRSVEVDALLLAASPVPAPDAFVARDEKAGDPTAAAVDPRVTLMVQECWRHSKVVGAWGDGVRAVAEAGADGSAGVVLGDAGTEVLGEVGRLLAQHRVWERFATSPALA